VNNELEIWNEVAVGSLRYYSGICLEGLRKIMNISQDSQSLSSDLNQRPPEYKTGVLPSHPCCSFHVEIVTCPVTKLVKFHSRVFFLGGGDILPEHNFLLEQDNDFTY
jgi:hypothetical protein